MATLSEFNEANGTPVEDGVIVSPNIKRGTIAENAARAGFKETPQPDAETQREVDLVNDLGLKSTRQVAEEKAFENDDIAQALGPQLEAAAERRKAEYEQFKDALDQCGGEMTKEDLSMMTDEPDYSEMLSNPPDPLNSEIKKYTQQQIERFKETASEEELMAMGLATDIPQNEHPHGMPETPSVTTDIDEYKAAKQKDEDEKLMKESEEMAIPDIPARAANVLNEVNAGMASNDEMSDNIPVVPPDTTVSAVSTPTIQIDGTNNVEKPKNAYYAARSQNNPENVMTSIPASNPVMSDTDIDREMESLDYDEEYVDEEAKAKEEERMERARNVIRQKVIPIANKMNISGFVISDKPVSIGNSVEMAKAATPQGSAKWGLFATGRPIVMTGLFGHEIDDLSRFWHRGNASLSVSDVYKKYTYLYNHVISPKPPTVEEWLKTISFMDVRHLYATGYKASFEKTNFLPVDCSNEQCGNGFITDNVPFSELVSYENSDARKKAEKILNSEPPEREYNLYHTEVVPISDVYAMSFKDPSIYDVEVAPKYLEADWYDKMKDTIAINMYVDRIFVIDAASGSLRPLAIKEYPNNPQKTLKMKVLALAKVLPTFTSDQYNLLSSYIETINKNINTVNYQKPAVICPECGTKIDAEPAYAQELLFTRHRLTALVSG